MTDDERGSQQPAGRSSLSARRASWGKLMWRGLRGANRSLQRASPELAYRLQAAVDYHIFRREATAGLGPFNGQERRQEMMRRIASRMELRAVVETGTYLGETCEFMRRAFQLPVYTVEANPRYFFYSRRRFARDPHVHVVRDDSRVFLKRLGQSESFPSSRILFYLDAHWEFNLPLWEEVALIHANWRDSLTVIDDFEVPGDAGYGFDDYGPGKRLSLDCYDLASLSGVVLFWPAAPSSAETGHRRGCILVASSEQIASALDGVNEVRRHASTGPPTAGPWKRRLP
jgi:hypothetical protein